MQSKKKNFFKNKNQFFLKASSKKNVFNGLFFIFLQFSKKEKIFQYFGVLILLLLLYTA